MEPFTYKDYLFYTNNNIVNLSDVNEEYHYKDSKNVKKINSPHDRVFKELLDIKEEAIEIINKSLGLENTEYELKAEDIEKYNRNFILEGFDSLNSDIVYKMKNRNIYFLIEHQSKIDYSMPYRILNYNLAIMKSALQETNIKNKNYKLPQIYSFVIYTGKKKWNAGEYIAERQERLLDKERHLFGKFKVIDVNEYTKNELLNEPTLLSKIMLLEKANSTEEILKYLYEILECNLTNTQKSFIKRVVNYILKNKIPKEEIEKINKKLEMGDGENMLRFEKMLGDYIDEKLSVVRELETKVKNMQTEVKNKQIEVKNKENEVKNKETEVKNKENEVNKKEKELADREKKLVERERYLKLQNNAI